MEEISTNHKLVSKNPSVVTDWRTEIYGEVHHGSFVWDEVNPSKNQKDGCTICGRKCFCCKGKKATLKGPKLKLPEKVSIIEYFNERMATIVINPLSKAIIFGKDEKETLTYHELDVLTNALAALLIKSMGPDCKNLNLDGDIIIALCIPPTVRYVALVFAILKLGLAFLPIAIDLPEKKAFSVINDARPILTIVTSDLLGKFKELFMIDMFNFVVIEDFWRSLDEGEISTHLPAFIQTLPGDPKGKSYPPLFKRTVAIINVSNSKGIFTGVRIKSRSIFNFILWEWKHFKLLPDERTLLQSDLDTVMSLLEIFSCLLCGNTLVILEPKFIKHPIILLDKIHQYNLIRLHLWPTLFHSLLTTVELLGEEVGREYLNSVKYWFCVGGDLTLEMGETFFSLLPGGGRLLINLYGNDEDMGSVCYQIIDSVGHMERLNYHYRLPIGTPLPNIKIYVVDDNMKVVRGDKLGQICVAGKQIADSYSESESPPKKLVPNPFTKSSDFQILLKTGDYGRVIKGDFGQRYLICETSRSLQIHAFIEDRICELGEIQVHLKNMKMVKDSHVICYRHGHEDQVIVAFCCVENPEVLPKVIFDLKKTIPPYMYPDMVGIQEIPKMQDGTANENYLLRKYYDVMIARKQFDDWESLGNLTPEQLHATKVLFNVTFSMVGVSFKELAKMYNSRFLAIPRTNYSKAVFVVRQLHENRYLITLEEFMNADNLREIVNLMVKAQESRGMFLLDQDCISSESKFTVETMTNSHTNEVLDLLSNVLTGRGSVDYYSEVKKSDLKKFLMSMWVMFVTKKLSKVVKRNSDRKIVGAIINVNWHDEMAPGSVFMTLEISYRLQLMQILEEGFGETDLDPVNSTCIQIVYAGLDTKSLVPLEVHSLMERMVAATVETAKRKNYDAVIFTTYDYFVTDICVTNFGFTVIRECKLNEFVAADGRRPYHVAPDTLVGSLCLRKTR